MKRIVGDDVRRFWSRVEKKDRCWEWTGSRSPLGYGRINIRRKIEFAHRMSVWIHTGRWPESDEAVLHVCDNPSCIHPDHLVVATQKENARDRENKGRGNQPRGSRNGKTIFDEAEVSAIKNILRTGEMTKAELARFFGCSFSAIKSIEDGRTWGHIE